VDALWQSVVLDAHELEQLLKFIIGMNSRGPRMLISEQRGIGL